MKYLYNEQLIEDIELKIPINDHGFLYGVGLFETFRVYDGVPFLFAEHIKRLKQGLKLIGIHQEIELSKMNASLKYLLEANYLKNAYVRITVTAGVAPFGLPNEEYKNPAIIWQIKLLEPLSDSFILDKKAVILKIRQSSMESEVKLKSLNFLNNILAKQEIFHLKNTEGIFLTNEGYVSEGIVSNIFFVKGGRLLTPGLETGILNGITREHVINLCIKNCIPFNEGLFNLKDLLNADEIFMTNSIQEIVPIINLENKNYPIRDNGITPMLIKEYKASIRKVIERYKGSGKI
ncbi:MAG: aminodeoxychorismate lyase [Vulcanibacillus sp.]